MMEKVLMNMLQVKEVLGRTTMIGIPVKVSDDGFCFQTDRSQGAEDEYTLDFNQNSGKRIVMTLKKK